MSRELPIAASTQSSGVSSVTSTGTGCTEFDEAVSRTSNLLSQLSLSPLTVENDFASSSTSSAGTSAGAPSSHIMTYRQVP